uniref:C3H1-type domain-containing protein n=1 Tax=Noctiluca scintillans TaxID=2966 RepID=A0A7S1EW35_NOCSC
MLEVRGGSPETRSNDPDDVFVQDKTVEEGGNYGQGTTYHGLPVRNTFIHFDESVLAAPTTRECRRPSAPSVLFHPNLPTKPRAGTLETHRRGLCRPCAYHLYKPDGCRKGDECTFCHFCAHGEVKKWKKVHKRQVACTQTQQHRVHRTTRHTLV